MILAPTRAPRTLEQLWAPFTTGLASFPPPIRLDRRAAGLSDPVPFGQITGDVGPCAQPYPPDGWRPGPIWAPGPTRHLYDHPDVVGRLGRWGRAGASGTPDSTAAACCGEGGAAWSGAGADT